MARKYNSFTVPTRPAQLNSETQTSVVILGSQILNRTKTLGSHYLLPLSNGQSLIEHQITEIKAAIPNSEIIFVGGFEIDRVIKKKINRLRIIENLNYETNNQVEEARLSLINIVNNHVVLIANDALFDRNSFEDMFSGSSTLDYIPKEPSESVGVRSNGGYVECFSYHVETKWPGIVYLTGKELEIFKQYCLIRENGKKYLFEGLNYLLSKRNIRMIKNGGKTGKINGVGDISSI